MRDLTSLDHYRMRTPEVAQFFGGSFGDHKWGAFLVPSIATGEPLKVLASVGMGWDHVSVSCQKRCPSWEEMEQVKRLFFRDSETAMQLHVPPADHINFHPYCLHLWRPLCRNIPRPPAALVGAG